MYKRMQWIFGAAALTVALTACPEITEQDRQDNLIARDQTGTVITADGTEAEFDFKSGKDCFKLAYEDNRRICNYRRNFICYRIIALERLRIK